MLGTQEALVKYFYVSRRMQKKNYNCVQNFDLEA
jgi:hypothetical protein